MAPCEVCTKNESKYTCPRCRTRTCSAPCAKTHKDTTGCTGERDKAAYVPMNQYTWGSLMDDYTFLEDIGRKAADWGSTIVRNGYLTQTQRGRGSARGGMRRTAATRSDGRRAYLRTQLELRDIELELLPDGMTRRRLNQSFWDPRSKTAMLTLELIFHPPTDTLALVTDPPPPFTLLSHRNDFSRPLVDLVCATIAEHQKRKGKTPLPGWIVGLVEDRTDLTTLYLVAQTDFGPSGKVTTYRRLDATVKLSKALKNMTVVEFAVIHIWDAEAFDGRAADGPELQPPAKRRRLDSSKEKSNMMSLLGDYASDEDDAEEIGVANVVGEYDSDQDQRDPDDDDTFDMDDALLMEDDLEDDDSGIDETRLAAADEGQVLENQT